MYNERLLGASSWMNWIVNEYGFLFGGTRKKRRTSDFKLAYRNYRTLQRLSIIKMQICHSEEIYFFKTNSPVSIHSPMHMMLESLENLTLWMVQSCFCLSFVGLWIKTLQMAKKLVKMISCSSVGICSDVCYHNYLSKKLVVFSWAKPIESLPVDFRLFNCVLR